MESLLDGAQGVTPFERVLGWLQCFLIGHTECDARLQCRGVPAGNENGKHGLVATRRYTQEINDWYSVLKCLAQPAIVGGVRVLTHEGVIDRLVALENLPVHLALVVIPDFAARASLAKSGSFNERECRPPQPP